MVLVQPRSAGLTLSAQLTVPIGSVYLPFPNPMKRRFGSYVLLVCLGLMASGCASGMLARKLASAPNRESKAPVPAWLAQKISQTYADSWRVGVGPDGTELAVAVIEPGDYRFSYGLLTRLPVCALAQPGRSEIICGAFRAPAIRGGAGREASPLAAGLLIRARGHTARRG
jgi:hypothetical protein